MSNLKNLPKVELHLHLDGSIKPELASNILNRDLEQVKKDLIAPKDCQDLNDYLTKFAIPEEILQTKDNIIAVSEQLAKDLKEENVIYAEIRFAPMKHLKRGLTKEEVVDSVIEGLSKVDIKTNLILCMMRGASKEENTQVIYLAKRYLGKGVCAVDLAGAEAIYPTSDYEDLFALARKEKVPFTIHAGEAAGKKSIASALSFIPTRIGHGVRITEDENLIKQIKKANILLEICPTSNIQTRIYTSYQEHPIKEFYNKFIPISINTDNRTVSNTTLTEEYQLLIDKLNFTINDIININKISIMHTFLSKEEKDMLLNEYQTYLDEYYKND